MGDTAAELRADEHGLMRVVKRLLRDIEGELVLVVDQFEELYTLVLDDAQRRAFTTAVIAAVDDPKSRLRVLATIRADFFDRPLVDDLLASRVAQAHLAIGVPDSRQLVEVIERPAQAAGVRLDPAVTAQLVADVREEPGALPLMQFMLSDLVDGSPDGAISIGAYDEGGGVLGAIGRRAGDVFDSLDADDQAVAEHVFLRLVTVSDDADDVRRRVRRSELESLDVARRSVDRVLDAFGAARLLTFDRDPITRGPTVEVAHEALLREWEQFREWATERRASLLTRARFESAMEEWSTSGQAEDHLPTGGRLAQFEEWATDPLASLAAREESFLDAAAARRDREHGERRRRRRSVLGGFAAAAVVAIVLAVAAWVARGDAEENAALAEARALTLEADRAIAEDPELALLLAVESIRTYRRLGLPVPASLSDIVQRASLVDRVVSNLPGGRFVAVSPDGEVLYTRTEGREGVAAIDVQSGNVITEVDTPEVLFAEINPADGGLILTFRDEPVQIWRGPDLSDRSSVGEAVSPFGLFGTSVSANGDLLVLINGDSFTVYDYATLHDLYTDETASELVAVADDGRIAYSPAGRRSDGFEGQFVMRLVDVYSGESADVILDSAEVGNETPLSMSFSPDGRLIAYADRFELGVIDPSSRSILWSTTEMTRPLNPRWLGDGSRLIVGGESGLFVVDAESGSLVQQLPGHKGGSPLYVEIPGTSLIASAGWVDGRTLISDAGSPLGTEVERIEIDLQAPALLESSADASSFVATSFLDDQVSVAIDPSSGQVIEDYGSAPDVGATTYPEPSPDGSYVVLIDSQARSFVRDMRSGERVYTSADGWFGRAVSPDLTYVLEVSVEHDLPVAEIVEVSTGSRTRVGGHEDVTFASISSDSRYLLTHSFGDIARLIDLHSGSELNQIDVGSGGLETAAFRSAISSEADLVAIGRSSGDIDLFSLGSLARGSEPKDALVRTIPAHNGFIIRTEFSPNGRSVASVSWDEPARVWDVDSGQRVGEFGAPNEFALVAFGYHQTEPWIHATLPGDILVTYTLDIDELVEIAESRLSRDMTEEECQQYLRRSCGDT